MARPAQLTRLTTGKALGAFDGFVDTFNYLLDFIENLRCEGDEDSGKSLKLDRSVPDAPVIRGGGGGGGMNLIPGDDTNIVFTPYNGQYKVDVYYR